MPVPPYHEMFNPALQAVRELGGSCSISEMSDRVAKTLNLLEDEVNEIHKGNMTKLEYRLSWARNYLKNYGLFENSTRGVWALTAKGRETKNVDTAEVRRVVRALYRRTKAKREEAEAETVESMAPVSSSSGTFSLSMSFSSANDTLAQSPLQLLGTSGEQWWAEQTKVYSSLPAVLREKPEQRHKEMEHHHLI
jgi:restriction endonuclease Mrr